MKYAEFRKHELITRFETNSCQYYGDEFSKNLVASVYLIFNGEIICQSGKSLLFNADSLGEITILPEGLLIKGDVDGINGVYALKLIHREFIEKRTRSIFGDAFEYVEFLEYFDLDEQLVTFGHYDLGGIIARVDIKKSHFVSLFTRTFIFSFIIIFALIYWIKVNSNDEKKKLKELRKAIRNRTLHMNYQPIFDNLEEIKGFEALVRWSHPKLGVVTPNEFIPLAEKYRLIDELTDCVFRTVIDELTVSSWRFVGKSIGINVPPTYIQSSANLDKLELYYRELSKLGYIPVIELTERDLISNESIENLQRLKKKGYLIAIDDFGTGYTGLSMLGSLPIDYIKVDRFFINSIERGTVNVQLLETILDLSQKLNLPIVAEGVETSTQAEYLKRHHCQNFQGYWYSKPLEWNETGKYRDDL